MVLFRDVCGFPVTVPVWHRAKSTPAGTHPCPCGPRTGKGVCEHATQLRNADLTWPGLERTGSCGARVTGDSTRGHPGYGPPGRGRRGRPEPPPPGRVQVDDHGNPVGAAVAIPLAVSGSTQLRDTRLREAVTALLDFAKTTAG